jgi:hypothetical protein
VFADTWWKNKESLSRSAHFPDKDIRGEDFKKYINVYAKKWEALARK